jgi:hypothetical protein
MNSYLEHMDHYPGLSLIYWTLDSGVLGIGQEDLDDADPPVYWFRDDNEYDDGRRVQPSLDAPTLSCSVETLDPASFGVQFSRRFSIST